MDPLVTFIVEIAVAGAVGFGTGLLALGKYKQKIDTLEEKVGTLEKEIKDVQKELTTCSTKIDERTQSYASTLTKRKSPLSLTEKGEELLKRSGADKFIIDHKDILIKEIGDKNPKSAYDVQVFAKEVVESMSNKEEFTSLKDFAFKEGIEIDAIFIVMSIYLRDLALASLGFNKEETK